MLIEEARTYPNGYTVNDLRSALDKIKSGRISVTKALKDYGISMKTLHNKLKATHKETVGGQYWLTEECKSKILLIINALFEWKSPLTGYEVRLLVKNYLDCRGVIDAAFNNNFPGEDWLNAFAKQYKLTKRLADSVMSARSELSPDILNILIILQFLWKI